jgi:hypothetical protein
MMVCEKTRNLKKIIKVKGKCYNIKGIICASCYFKEDCRQGLYITDNELYNASEKLMLKLKLNIL